jgi:drug/metabolite transporter (DMT)-like permease
MKLSRHQLAVLAIIANTIIWSAASPIFKWSLDGIPPFTMAFFRFFIASLILLPFVMHKLKVSLDDFYKLLVLSLVGMTLHITFFYLGLTLAPSINVPIISSTTPILLIVGGMLFLREKPKRKVVYGTAVSLIGFFIIIIQPMLEKVEVGSILGNIYYALSVITLVLYTILLKRYNFKYSYMTIMFWIFTLSTLAFLPMFLLENQGTDPFVYFDLKGVIGILYGALLSSLAGYFLYNYAVKHIKAQEIGIFMYLDPFVTALVAIPLLGETITFTYLLGTLFVFAGIVIAENRLHYHPFHRFRTPPGNA